MNTVLAACARATPPPLHVALTFMRAVRRRGVTSDLTTCNTLIMAAANVDASLALALFELLPKKPVSSGGAEARRGDNGDGVDRGRQTHEASAMERTGVRAGAGAGAGVGAGVGREVGVGVGVVESGSEKVERLARELGLQVL